MKSCSEIGPCDRASEAGKLRCDDARLRASQKNIVASAASGPCGGGWVLVGINFDVTVSAVWVFRVSVPPLVVAHTDLKADDRLRCAG